MRSTYARFDTAIAEGIEHVDRYWKGIYRRVWLLSAALLRAVLSVVESPYSDHDRFYTSDRLVSFQVRTAIRDR